MKFLRSSRRLHAATFVVLVASSMIGACGQFALNAYKASSGAGGGSDLTTSESSSGATSGAGGGDYDAGSNYILPKNDSFGFLCGMGSCLPGSPAGDQACSTMRPGTGGATSSSSSSTSSTGSSGAGGASSSSGAGGAGGGTTSGSSGSSTSTSSGAGGAPPDGPLGCVVDMGANGVAAACKVVGTSLDNQPCNSTADCAAGLGCVKTAGSGVCRHYCCGKLEECDKGTYCFPVSSFDSGNAGPHIPVCLPASNCQLLNDATCESGLTCVIVRDDGTTTCLEPGPGHRGDPCAGTLGCAPGFYCSDQQACAKLCHTDQPGECDAPGVCQGGMQGFPSNIGICAGY